MSLALTHTELSALTEEIRELAVPSGVQKVFERDENGFVLQLRRRGETVYLLIDTHPEHTRLHFVEGKPAQPERPSAFVMYLRKRLIGATLGSVELTPDDRVVVCEFERRTEEGPISTRMVAELVGRGGNVFLLEEERVLVWQHARRARGLRLGELFQSRPAAETRSSPSDRFGLSTVPIGGRSELVSREIEVAAREQGVSARRSEIGSRIRREAKRLRRLVKNLEGDLVRAEDALQSKRKGELLQSAYGRDVPRGATAITVPDYYVDGSPEVSVELDPKRSLQQNIERYFHAYRRMNAAIGGIEERLLGAMDRLDRFADARMRLSELQDGEFDEFIVSLVETGLLKTRRQPQRRQQAGPQLPYRTFVARSGSKILVGRGAKHNDALTTKVARGRDVWMHARDWAGAHVVLRMERDGDPAGDDLRDAALLAAHFSKGRGDSLTDVTYTRAKFVRKPKGGAPGLVTVAGGSTIAVRPDDARLTELFAAEVTDG